MNSLINNKLRLWHEREAQGVYPVAVQRLNETINAQKPISMLLPYLFEEDDHLFVNKDSMGFIVQSEPATGLRSEDLQNLQSVFVGHYPVGTVIQVQLWGYPHCLEWLQRWAEARSTAGTFGEELQGMLAEKRKSFLAGGDWQSPYKDSGLLFRNFIVLISVSVPRKGRQPLSHVERSLLTSLRSSLVSILGATHMPSRNVSAEQLAFWLHDWFAPHPSRSVGPKVWPVDSTIPLNRQMIHDESRLYITPDHIQMQWRDHAYDWVSLSVQRFPERWHGCGNSELIGGFFDAHHHLPCPCALVMNVVVQDELNQQTLARTRLMRSTQMRDTEVGKYVPAWKQRQQDWNLVHQHMGQGARLVRVSYQVVAWTPRGKRHAMIQQICSSFDRLGWNLLQDRYQLPMRMLSALPMGVCQEVSRIMGIMRSWHTLTTIHCTHLAPWVAEWKGNVAMHERPLLMLFGRRGQYMFLNPFLNRKGNFNIAVAAASGAGKSFLTQDYVLSVLAAGGRVFILDSGGSYRNLCKLLNGRYLEFDKDTPVQLDPCASLREANETEVHSQLPQLKNLLACMASPLQRLEPKVLAILEQAILAAWRVHGSNTCLENIHQWLTQSEHGLSHDLALMLSPFCPNGMYGRYFTEGTALGEENLIVLELDGLNHQPELQSVVLLMLMQRITESMYKGDRSRLKVCIIDEAWRLLGDGQAAGFIEEGYRTARKFGGAFMTITQGLADYFRNPTTMACYANSDYVFLLRQKNESIDQARKNSHLALGPWEERLLRSLTTVAGRYSEIAIRSPEGWSVGRLVVDPWTEKLMSTRAEDVASLLAAQRQGYNMTEAIDFVLGASHAL